MKVQDLITIASTFNDDLISSNKLKKYIDKINYSSHDLILTPRQIYALVSELDLFLYEERPFVNE